MNDNALAVLDAAEIAQLTRFEERISTGLASFIEVGEALSAIRERRLYRATHDTFENYCREKWGMSKTHCNRLINSAEVVSGLAPIGAITTESQAREISRVEPEHRQAVVEKAVAATDGKITATALREAAKIVVPVVIETPVRERFTMPPRGLFLARGAIAELEKILSKDKERTEALRLVRDWCDSQLKSE